MGERTKLQIEAAEIWRALKSVESRSRNIHRHTKAWDLKPQAHGVGYIINESIARVERLMHPDDKGLTLPAGSGG